MKSILQTNSSLFGDDAQSSRLAGQFVEALIRAEQARDPARTGRQAPVVIVRDLAERPVPHLTAENIDISLTPKDQEYTYRAFRTRIIRRCQG